MECQRQVIQDGVVDRARDDSLAGLGTGRIVRVPFRRSDDRPHRTWLLHCGRPLRCSAFSWLLAHKGSVVTMGRRHRGAANYPIDRAMEWMSLGLAGERAAVRASIATAKSRLNSMR
jgi:hypothetical protein